MSTLERRLTAELDEAEKKAWDALGRYKFQKFGYWAAIWVHLNRVGDFKRPNPFRNLVQMAREPAAPTPTKFDMLWPPGGSVECPPCHWGFAASVIDEHIREKH